MIPATFPSCRRPACCSSESSSGVGGCVLDDEREGTVGRGTDRVATGGRVEECPSERVLCLEAVGNWAEVFIGDGVRNLILNRDTPSTDETVAVGGPNEQFSSMTSNVVGFRLAQGYSADSVHLF
jgi:hypothetical protein